MLRQFPDFYWCINGKKKGAQGIPLLKKGIRNGVAQSDLEKAEEFNGQFTDVDNNHPLISGRRKMTVEFIS